MATATKTRQHTTYGVSQNDRYGDELEFDCFDRRSEAMAHFDSLWLGEEVAHIHVEKITEYYAETEDVWACVDVAYESIAEKGEVDDTDD